MLQMAIGMIIPMLPAYAAQIGMTSSGVGLIVAMPSVARLVLNLPLGSLIDTIGRKPLLIIGTTVEAIGVLGTAFASSLATMLPPRLLVGAGSAGAGSAGTAYLYDVVDKFPERKGFLLGTVQAAMMLAFAAGPACGGLLAESAPIGGLLADRVGRTPIIAAGSAISALAIGALPWAESKLYFYVCMAAWDIGEAMLTAAATALTSDLTSEDKRGAQTSLGTQVQDLTFVIAPVLLGTVRSYLGVPYSKKYAVSEAPMYLDCCNLVRRCVLDLKDDFGFTIGHWNQSYQFDTLPVALSGVEEMRPGDLIFWAAEYNDPTKKPRKHNLVHVEVFLGGENGEMTIGSRSTDPDSFKGVAMHESFRTYGHACHNIRIFYRSIDTWLDGVCVSHCKECNWTLAERPSKSHTTANKYSLFGSGGVAGGAEAENVSGNRVLGECVPEDAEGE
ncbi:tubulin-tyrosine ligase family protein [Chrysochromulina tobinii]|uniref:Tubulin-tyrosine ligase family protein n=1 Tax=Chrysochromulina tobinii TaxID=1460289 RepID=A0A0M0JHN8_9EUKA|nr:tubulin-tyrosine ligase family protein [Chrysochromulina tobinii]|eukprot:KOO25758.1 tubulin-tyrosine ligase family protein [Chrysochromulina sp. CCMP291]